MANLDTFRREAAAWLEANAAREIVGLLSSELDGNWGGRGATFEPPAMKAWL